MIAESEIWQVHTHGEVFETDLETLRHWVGEGYVTRTDKVKKGSLTWIEAGRAPALRRIFTGEEKVEATAAASPTQSGARAQAPEPPAPEPAFVGTPSERLAGAPAPAFPHAPRDESDAGPRREPFAGETYERQSHAFPPQDFPPPRDERATNSCHFHPDVLPKYVCRVCGATFCGRCPNYVGASKVPLCKVCGDLCKPIEEIVAKHRHQMFQQSGFGFEDFGRALRYPFQNVWGLVLGAGLYGLLLMAGFRGRILASAVMFGCISLVINKVAYGKLDRNFLPDFSEMSIWDDIVVPVFLGLGVTIVTIGPTVLLVVALVFGWFGVSKQALPVPLAAPPAQEQVFDDEDMRAVVEGADPEREAEAARKLEQLRPGAQVARAAEQSNEPAVSPRALWPLVASAGVALVLVLLTLAWALFYYPMALAVAGYTEDFWCVINPLVGINTIRLMGWTYGKAFLMYLAVQVAALVFSALIGIVLAPFQLPFVGNLPAMFVDGVVTFYTSLVVACLLGLAIFKSADRLGINVD